MNTIPFRDRLACSISEACTATGLGRTTIYAEIGAGRLKTIKVGRRTLVLVDSIMTRLDARRTSFSAER